MPIPLMGRGLRRAKAVFCHRSLVIGQGAHSGPNARQQLGFLGGFGGVFLGHIGSVFVWQPCIIWMSPQPGWERAWFAQLSEMPKRADESFLNGVLG